MLYILQAEGGGMMSQLPFMAIMLGIIYFFFIRPSAKKQKQQDEFMTKLEKGQEIVTSSGIIGKIVKIGEKEMTIQTTEKTYLRITRGAVSNELTAAFNKVEAKK